MTTKRPSLSTQQQNEKDVGVVLDGVSEAKVQKILDAHPEAQVRVLSPQHGLYEIFGVSADEVAAQTEQPATPNKYFRIQSKIRSRLGLDVANMSVPAPDGLQVGNLDRCIQGNKVPTAVVRATPNKLNGATVDLGLKVRADSRQSKPATGRKLKTAFVIVAPSGSKYQDQIVDADNVDITPDFLGQYQVIAVVQDDSHACALDGISFIVTANRKYTGPNVKPLNIDLSKVTHLKYVNAEEAWQISEGKDLPIAIIDTGVNYNHPTLAPNILINADEKENGRDDDGNGLKDDVIGYDFVNNDAFPYDDDSHGTHVAGLAASRDFGMARQAKIIPIKAMTTVGGDMATIAASIRYAVDRGAKIINMSLGGAAPDSHPAINSAVAYAESKGVLLVVAAGNGDENGNGVDIDKDPVFPAAMPNKNILTISAFDKDNLISTYANYGKNSVDIVAPGGSAPDDPMVSAAYENPAGGMFIGMIGTSMACPVAAGIAAQVWSYQPQLTVAELKAILMSSGDQYPELRGITQSGRHLNAQLALENAGASSLSY